MVNSDIITNKKDLKIHKSSEILSTIFDISPDAIALTRVSDGKFIDCNQEYLNQIGYSQEEVIGHTSEELNLYVDENRQKYANEILIKKTATNFELKIRRKDGTIIHVLYSGRLIDVEGEQTLLNIGKNITERKKVEQQIKDNADLMDQLYDAVIRTDTNFKINYWNKAAEKMFGYSQDETLGNNSTELLSPIYAPGERETKSEELKKKGTLKTINKFKHKNGSDIIVEQNATQINDNSGVPISYVVVYQDITDLKKAENKQETLSKQLQLALDASSLGWWHYNPITDISTYDNRYKEIFGVLGSKRPNDEILKLLHPDDLPQVLSKVEKALDPVNPRKYYAKYRIYHNNEIRWIEAHGITTFEGHRDTKHAVSLVGTVNDITERKRSEKYQQKILESEQQLTEELQTSNEELQSTTEELQVTNEELRQQEEKQLSIYNELQESHKRLNKSLENMRTTETLLSSITNLSSDVIYVKDRQSRWIFVNPALERIVGKKSDDLLGKTDLEIYSNKEIGKKILANDNKIMDSGKEEILEEVVETSDGMRSFISVKTPRYNEKGQVIGIVGISHDITERKKTEESLYESKTKLETVIQSMNDAIFVSDTEGNFIDFNEAFATFHKFKSKEECYKTLDEYPDYIDVYLDNGKLAPIDMWAVPRALKGETVSNAEYMLQRKDTEEKWWGNYSFAPIRSKDENIIGSVVLARDITEQKTSEKELKSLLKEKEVLIKEIHHRVKNNMQIISSLLNLQTKYVDEEKAVNVLKESQNRVKSMAMIHEKLYLSEDLTHINFVDYIKSLITNLFYSYNIEKGKINQIFETDDVNLNIETAVPCGLIISELVSNSLKYAFPNEMNGKIFISLKSCEDEYELIIRDNGIGLPKDLEFNKLNSLGLLLVNNLTDQIDGKISINTDNGTEFKIKFKELKYKERL